MPNRNISYPIVTNLILSYPRSNQIISNLPPLIVSQLIYLFVSLCKQLDLPLESGYLLKYDFKLVQLKYGEREMDKVDGMQKIFIEDNLTNTTSRKTFNGLRPWSTYEFSILPINNHLQRGTNEAQLLVTTEESGIFITRFIN